MVCQLLLVERWRPRTWWSVPRAADVRPMLRQLRADQGLDPDPVAAYARSGYAARIAAQRVGGKQAGWGA